MKAHAIRIAGGLFLASLGFASLYRAATRNDGGILLSLDPNAAPPRSHAGAYVGDGLGINLLDNQDLEAVAETAAKLNRYEFMLSIAPVPVTGGTGFPLNALAVF